MHLCIGHFKCQTQHCRPNAPDLPNKFVCSGSQKTKLQGLLPCFQEFLADGAFLRASDGRAYLHLKAYVSCILLVEIQIASLIHSYCVIIYLFDPVWYFGCVIQDCQ